jgi:hypothetical protein
MSTSTHYRLTFGIETSRSLTEKQLESLKIAMEAQVEALDDGEIASGTNARVISVTVEVEA